MAGHLQLMCRVARNSGMIRLLGRYQHPSHRENHKWMIILLVQLMVAIIQEILQNLRQGFIIFAKRC
jgi:hypothetical protein